MNPETETGVKALTPGMVSLAGFGAYFEFLNRGQIIEKVIEADREGYDAVVVHCFADPGVRIARSVVNIPVIGPGESSLLFACMMGYKFGVVTVNAPNAVPGMETMIREYGLEDRAIHKPVRPITMPWKEWLRKGPEEAIELGLPPVSRAGLYGQPREKDFNRFREVFGLKTY